MESACPPDRAEIEWVMNELMSDMTSILWERLKFDKQERALAFLSINRERHAGVGRSTQGLASQTGTFLSFPPPVLEIDLTGRFF